VIDGVFGRQRNFGDKPEIREVTDLDDAARHYPIITGDYGSGVLWASSPISAGTPVDKPAPVFTKLDDSIVEDELERLRSGA
jgi:methionyl-tRNA synthetase